jgi:hypothetical protein
MQAAISAGYLGRPVPILRRLHPMRRETQRLVRKVDVSNDANAGARVMR